jgi:hypothetical protein
MSAPISAYPSPGYAAPQPQRQPTPGATPPSASPTSSSPFASLGNQAQQQKVASPQASPNTASTQAGSQQQADQSSSDQMQQASRMKALEHASGLDGLKLQSPLLINGHSPKATPNSIAATAVAIAIALVVFPAKTVRNVLGGFGGAYLIVEALMNRYRNRGSEQQIG